MTPAQRAAFFRALQKAKPAPTTELEYASPFELLIAVMLSAQATDVSVNRATRGLYAAANTPEAILSLGERKLRTFIRSIGLYNTKARNVMRTCRMLVEQYGGKVPAERAALESLPGVGRKTANVVLNTAFGEPVIAVDTHIFRVSNRTGLAPGRNVREVEDRLERAVPPRYRKDAHHWLILHGRYTCTARNPRCGNCPVFKYCEWPDKNDFLDNRLPAASRRRRTEAGS